MGLENLKSIFSNTTKFKVSDLTKFDSIDDLTSTRTIFDNSPEKQGGDINLLPPTPDKLSLFSSEHSTELNFNPRMSLPKNFQSIFTFEGNNVISFKKTNLSELESFSPNDFDKISPFIKTQLKDSIDFAPKTNNDKINKSFDINPIMETLDFTPLSENDEISKFSVLDFIPLTMAGYKDKLSESNLDDINVVTPFGNSHFFTVCTIFTV